MRRKILFFGSIALSLLVIVLVFVVPIIVTTKTEMGSIDYVGSTHNSTTNGLGSTLFAKSIITGVAVAIIAFLSIFVAVALIIFNKGSMAYTPKIAFILPNIAVAASLIIAPMTMYSSKTTGDSFAWYSESSSGSLNIFGWLFLIILIALGVFTFILAGKIKQEKIEELGIKQAESSGSKISTQQVKTKKDPKKAKEISSDDFKY